MRLCTAVVARCKMLHFPTTPGCMLNLTGLGPTVPRTAGMGHYQSPVSSISTPALTGTYGERGQAPLPKLQPSESCPWQSPQLHRSETCRRPWPPAAGDRVSRATRRDTRANTARRCGSLGRLAPRAILRLMELAALNRVDEQGNLIPLLKVRGRSATSCDAR
jgi:hypothetical protein